MEKQNLITVIAVAVGLFLCLPSTGARFPIAGGCLAVGTATGIFLTQGKNVTAQNGRREKKT